MNEQPVVTLETRDGGDGSGKQIRRKGKAPGVLYGHGEPLSVATDAHDFRNSISPQGYGSQLVRVQLDGRDIGTVLVKAVQLNTVTREIMNIDFQRVSSEDRLSVSIAIVVEGESADARFGAVLQQSMHSVNLRCSAAEVPAQITIDASALHMGDTVRIAQLPIPLGCEAIDKPDEVILIVSTPTVPALEELVTMVEAPPADDGIGTALTGEKQKDEFPPEL